MKSTKTAVIVLACLSISLGASISEAKRTPMQAYQRSFKRKAPKTYRYLSDPANQKALVRGLQNALRRGGLSNESVGALSSTTRRIASGVAGDMKDSRGQTATLIAPAVRKVGQILRISGITRAMRKTVKRSKKYDNDPVVLKLNNKMKEIDSWPEARRKALVNKIMDRVEADPYLKAAIENLRKDKEAARRAGATFRPQLTIQEAAFLGKRVLAVARTTLQRDLGFSRAEADRIGTVSADITAPMTKTLQIYLAPKNIYQKAVRLARVTRMGLKGTWFYRKRGQLTALGENLGARFDKEMDKLMWSVKEDPGKFDSKQAETALKANPAWKALEAAANADAKK